ncbi:hypothetical protein H5410_037191 [Solanum commersonii]|uniref:Uncharacterized protein n=1 Tax=Solanum commersonii TaxID=4109 RepID=A0A9J5Y7S5_SOLCO|nr:hypothetical protein H5410_037191 [Solanum commersonii]
MTRTRSMTSKKPSAPSRSFEVDILSLSSDSSIGSMASPFDSSKKRASTSKQKASKKPRPLVTGSLSQADMQRFWGIEQKHMYDIFKSRPIVPGHVVNLSQLKDSLCPFSWVIPYMNGTWHDGFEISLEGVKRVVAEPDSNIPHFGALSLCFENCILAHIVATTLIPRKGSLSNISTRDVFVLYYLLRKYRINWVEWFKKYMWESAEDTNASASLSYGLLISRILVDRLVDLSMFSPIVGDKWVKKDLVKARAETHKPSKFFANPAAILLQDNDEVKTRLLVVERGLETLHDAVEKVFHL